MKRSLPLFGLVVLVLACGDTPTGPAPDTAESIQDATINFGNQAFYWLPPILKDPSHAGVFNPQLKPKVVICRVDPLLVPTDCAVGEDPLAEWSIGAGLTVSIADEHYGFEWHTDQTATDYDATYRIQVFLTELETDRLGYADVQFFSNGHELKNIDTGETIALRDGRTLPGRFRIEKGASCNGEADCGEASIGPDGGTVTTESGRAGVEIPQGAVDGDILIRIRRVDPSSQDWGRCLPTGLRQEEGCYEFDTEPSIEAVNGGSPTFHEDVVVGVCIDAGAQRPERLRLHKYDPETPAAGVTELAGAPANFLSCDGNIGSVRPDGLIGRFAAAARRLIRPVASLITVRNLYASDEGRGGVTDAFSFIGWAEPVELSLLSAPTAVLPGAEVPATVHALTSHNLAGTALDASGHLLRFAYTDPTGEAAVLSPGTTDAAGQASPAWTLTETIGIHTLAVSTRLEIDVDGEPFLVPDPTAALVVTVGGYQTANACADPAVDCGQAIVDGDGETVVTDNGFAGVDIPTGALDGPVLVTIRRVDPAAQPWQKCLPTGLRQEEGCYEFDTEPALGEVNEQDAFNGDVVVAVCIDPEAARKDRLALHKFDPENPTTGVVELAGAAETFLTCDDFAYDGDAGLFGRFARSARRFLAPVATMVVGRPLYASDEGRGGVTDAFSFIGWAEPVDLSVGSVPAAVLPATAVPTTVQALTGHNHGLTAQNASGHTLRLVYTDPVEAEAVLAPAVTDASGQASPSWTLTGEVGIHSLAVSTRMVVGGVEIPDPTAVLTVTVGGYQAANACVDDPDCGQAIVGEDGDIVLTSTGFAGAEIPPGALDAPVLITIRRIDPDDQAWGNCLPTGLRQEEGCYEYDTEPALGDVNQQDAFNTSVVVAVCIDPTAIRPDRLTLHKYDPDKPLDGVVELPGASGGFVTCDNFAAIPNGFLGRLAHAGRRLLGPIASPIAPRPLYASDEGRGGVTDAFSFIGWAESVTLAMTTEPNALDPAITDVVVTAATAHNHGSLPLPADGATIRFEYTDPSTNVTVSDVVTTIAGAAAEARISLTAQGGTHNVKASTQQEILIDSDFLVASGAAGYGIFAAPTISLVGVPTPFVVPDPTLAVESGDVTVFGLVSRWDADDPANPFADRVGPNHGQAIGAVDAGAQGISGNGFFFDGAGGYVTATADHIGEAEQFTVSAWVKLNPAGSPWDIQRFVTVGGPEGEKAVLRQEATNSGHVARLAHFYAGFGPDPQGTGADLHHVLGGSDLLEGCWQYLTGTFDGQQLAFYTGARLIGTRTVDAAIGGDSHRAEHVDLGSPLADVALPEAFTGILDEIEVRNHALSVAEIDELFGRHRPTCDATTGLIGGVVRHADTGEPLAGVTVNVAGLDLFATTDAEGRYVIRDVPLATQTVVGILEGFEEARQTVAVTDVGRTTGADHLNMRPTPPAPDDRIAHLTLQSEDGDFVGQGGTYDITYTPENSQSFFANIRRTIGTPAEPAELSFTMGTVTSGSDNTFAGLMFGTDKLGIPIQPGTYVDAQRADFAETGHPGLDVSFQNRGCNTVTGSFTIQEVTFSTGSSGTEIETLSVTFELHCEGAAAALRGTFTYGAHGNAPDARIDQFNDRTESTTVSGTEDGGSLFQTFIPNQATLEAVQLGFRKGGSFPANGFTSIVQIREGSFTGPVIGQTGAFISADDPSDVYPIHRFSVPIAVDPGATYVIEWLTTAATTVSWYISGTSDPYPPGTALGPAGTVLTDEDFVFWTYY